MCDECSSEKRRVSRICQTWGVPLKILENIWNAGRMLQSSLTWGFNEILWSDYPSRFARCLRKLDLVSLETEKKWRTSRRKLIRDAATAARQRCTGDMSMQLRQRRADERHQLWKKEGYSIAPWARWTGSHILAAAERRNNALPISCKFSLGVRKRRPAGLLAHAPPPPPHATSIRGCPSPDVATNHWSLCLHPTHQWLCSSSPLPQGQGESDISTLQVPLTAAAKIEIAAACGNSAATRVTLPLRHT
ncbi:hypothetical protein DFH09DRAFT_1108134 [Mycena vulgaris]|nr:hypothetical protein DFH09DRAFT_1108134 [Mycena vulgaris]